MIIKIDDPGRISVYSEAEVAGLCCKKYKSCKTSYKYGCINFGKKPGCPPQPSIDKVLDFEKEMYLVLTEFDLVKRAERIKIMHPNWTEGQLYNCRQYQPTTRSQHTDEGKNAKKLYGIEAFVRSPEAHGVNLSELSMMVCGFDIWKRFEEKKILHTVSIAGYALPTISKELRHLITYASFLNNRSIQKTIPA